MKPPIVIIGIGELASVFARAFLRSGYPVYPITRSMNMAAESANIPSPEMVLVAVAENDFQQIMASLPTQWRDKAALIQNELLPRDWQAHDLKNPTVMSVWFEKKRGMDYKPLIPSPVYGPAADLIAESLAGIEIPCRVLNREEDLVFELVLKNVFVFTINIAGLVLAEGTTTSILWRDYQKLALDVADNVIDLQEIATGNKFSRDRLKAGLVAGITGDPDHRCRGRSAPGRLQRVLETAAEAGLSIPAIEDVSRRLS